MDMLENLNCPQYLNFTSVMRNENSLLNDVETPLTDSCVKDDTEIENMEEGNSYYPENLQSSFCESYIEHINDQEPIVDAEVENMEDENSYYHGSLQSSLYESYNEHSNIQGTPISLSSYQSEDFPVNRPKNSSFPDKAPKKKMKVNKVTKVKPFNLTEGKKRKREYGETEHVPLAEQVAAFNKTPQRFHTTGPKAFEPTEHWSPPIINPKSPNLRAAKRVRRIDILSREEQEEKEAEEIKRYKFRARPLNRNFLNRPQLLHIGKKTPTKTQNLNLRTAQRAAEIYARKRVEEKPYEFHARPVPKAILNGPIGLKEKMSLPVTQAKTPNFALKSRAEKWKSENKLNESTETQTFKALPAPAFSSPFVVKNEKKCTIPEPFSFDSRDKEKKIQKEQKIVEEIEKENSVYVFKAQPMPSPVPSALPAIPKKLPTLPEPFSFYLEEKGSKHSNVSSTFDQTCPIFKAQPATVLEKPPFIPAKTDKQPVEIKEFHLYTDIRASERQKLKEINDLKEQEKDLALQRLKELQEEEERREIQKLRKEIVHKAQPIRNYKPVEIKPSSKPPTQPLSPKFKTEERLQLRH